MALLPEPIRSLQFLIVDDYESMRIFLADHLEKLGVEKILFAISGNEALQVLAQAHGTKEQVEFVLTDLLMEDGSGIDLLKSIRSRPEFKDLPVLMVTSKAEVSIVMEAIRTGVSNYIVKPWKIEELAKKIIDVYFKSKGIV